ncbi:hypothetical protein MRS44_003623 [Fusarium solani]|uniref:uncharacterized protein n=1 Tax=Fusarium solani TaxID=169388 RepID=UPI0032C456EE|nr:hypothetical protein MRS44_003623 [Fusarium solani]
MNNIFHRFFYFPWDIREQIWKFALRPSLPGVHTFKLYKPNSGNGTDENIDIIACHTRQGSLRLAAPDRKQKSPTGNHNTDITQNQGNHSTYLVDGGLWTACNESRHVIQRHFGFPKWRSLHDKDPERFRHKAIRKLDMPTIGYFAGEDFILGLSASPAADVVTAAPETQGAELLLATPSVDETVAGSDCVAKHLLDLRMMHHYCIFTAESLAAEFTQDIASILKVELPRLAYKHEFLMDTILLMAMVHLGCTEPELLQTLPVYLYRDQALRTLRQAIGNMTDSNTAAVKGASVLLATMSFATDRVSQQSGLWLANWLTLAHGRRNIHLQPTISEGQAKKLSGASLYGSFHDVPESDRIASGILRAIQRDRSIHDGMCFDTLHRAGTEVSRLISALESPRDHLWLTKQIKAWAFDVIEPGFLELVRQERPCALVILMHYLALFGLLPRSWVYDGLVSHDMEIMVDKLGPEWEDCIVLPKMALHVEGREALTELLLSCL